jgi:hypothetical protein
MRRALPRGTLGLIALVLAGEAFAACFPSLGGLAGSGGAAAGTGDETTTASAGPSTSSSAGPSTGTAATTATTGTSTSSGAGGCGGSLADDSLNCGACGHDCLGGDCAAGSCQPFVLLSGQTHPIDDLAVYEAVIYWTAGDLHLRRMPEDGQGPPAVIASAGDSQIAVEGGFVYFFNPGGSVVESVSANGGTPAELLSAPGFVRGLAADATGVYLSTDARALYRGPLEDPDAGTPPAEIASTENEPFAVATDDTNVYAASYYQLVFAPKDAGSDAPASPLNDATSMPDVKQPHLAVDGEGVAWAVQDGGAARYSVVAPMGLVSPMLVSASIVVTGITAEPGHVYVTEEDGTVAMVPPDGGAAKTLAQNQEGARLPVVSATAIYWVTRPDGGDDAIVKLAK